MIESFQVKNGYFNNCIFEYHLKNLNLTDYFKLKSVKT